MSTSKSQMLFTSSCMLGFLLLPLHSAVVDVENSGIKFGKKGDLIFVHVLQRHGDRSPFMQYPGDKYDISYWPQGWGQLTNLGKQQHFTLGKNLRRRYKTFLSSTYNSSDIYVRSSDIDRTLIGAQITLAGLYPPNENQIWNRRLRWQPIPIHTMPLKIDNIVAGEIPECRSYQKAYDKYTIESVDLKSFQKSNKPLYEYLSFHTGEPLEYYHGIWSVTAIFDSWKCQRNNNLSLPQWSQTLLPNNETFYKAALKPFYLPTATKHLSKFSGGFLLKDLLDRFTSKIERSLQPDRKFFIYSTHDSRLTNLLRSLNIFDNKFIPYASALIWELRHFRNDHYVQIFFKNSKKTPHPIHIPGCGISCPLTKMYELYDDILPKNDFETECQIDE